MSAKQRGPVDPRAAVSSSPEGEQQFRLLFDAVGNGLLVHHWETGVILDANPAADALHGYPRGGMIGLRPSQLARLEDLSSIGPAFEMIRLAVPHGGQLDERRIHRRKDGTSINLDATWQAIPFAGAVHLLCVLREAPTDPDASNRESAAREERLRLARELHDSTCQSLYGISLGARSAKAFLRSDPDQAAESLSYLLALSESAVKDLRALVFNLRADDLETEGLVAMLHRHADRLRERHGLQVQIEAAKEPLVAREIKDALYRIVLEATRNTVKHAQAHQVTVRLLRSPSLIVLEISDDGAGFDPTLRYKGHFGLHAMAERLLPFRGSLEVNSQLGRGTRVRARVPLIEIA